MEPMEGSLDHRYDFALLGTSLPLSILSAALSRAGYSVLHVDDAEHYGGPWASLTLDELVQRSKSKDVGGIVEMQVSFPGGAEIPEELQRVNRHFAISLAPTLLPCAGPTIDVLVRSRVSNYCTFRLLQQTAVCSNEGRAKDDHPLRSVPSSKEDIFKDKTLSLIDKRKLMKLLQQAMPSSTTDDQPGSSSSSSNDATARALLGKTFSEYLVSREGPAFSQRLASDVAYGVALCASADDSAVDAMQRVQRHISSVGRYGNSAYLIGQYGGAGEMAQCYCRASAVQGGTFVLAHSIRRLQRTGGAQPDDEADRTGRSEWQIELEGIGGTSNVGCVIGDHDLLKQVLPSACSLPSKRSAPLLEGRQAVGVMLLDRGMDLRLATQSFAAANTDQPAVPAPPPPETALVVFPPSDDGSGNTQKGAVWALQMGEGTFSCPKGTYLVYLYAALPRPAKELDTVEQAKEVLRGAREGVLKLAGQSDREWHADCERARHDPVTVTPLFECYMIREAKLSSETQDGARESASKDQRELLRRDGLVSVTSNLANVATALDEATVQAEDLYWLLCSPDEGDRQRDAIAIRRDAEAARRRQQRANAGENPIGRGLAGTIETEDSSTSDISQTTCDFFPASDQSVDD